MKKQLCLILALSFALCSAKAKTVDRILAKVNDDIITLSELNRTVAAYKKELAKKYSGDQLEQETQKIEKQALDSLIEDRLLYQKAVEMGYNTNSEPKVAAYIQNVIKEYKLKDTDDLEQELAKEGKTLREFREDILKDMIKRDLVNDFVGSRITLLKPEIEKYYKDHIVDYTTPAEVTLSEIIISGDANAQESESRANDLYARLQKGESFAALASQYSKGPTANKGGIIGAYIVSKLNPETAKQIAGAKEGETTKPQKMREGFVIYHIDSLKAETVRPLADVSDDIRKKMYDERFNPELERFIVQLKEDAYIEYFSDIK